MRKRRRYIVVNDWWRFQHYKNRHPVWIKNYLELLHDDDYLRLSANRRGILHGIWMEYASARCVLADDTASLSRALGVKVTSADLVALNHAGFIGFAASKPLAARYQPASPEQEAEAEEENPKGNALNYEEPEAPSDFGNLSDERYFSFTRLLSVLPKHLRTEETRAALTTAAGSCPVGAIEKVRESLAANIGRIENPVGYAVNALRDEAKVKQLRKQAS